MMGRREQSHSGLGRTQNLSALSAGRLRVHCRALELRPAESEKGLPGSLTLHTAASSLTGTRTTADKAQKSREVGSAM